MLKRNYHTHTPRCEHAEGREEEYVRAAIGAGFAVLGKTRARAQAMAAPSAL